MQYFKSDYMEGAHPLILERLCQTNMEKTSGYGTDEYCASGKRICFVCCVSTRDRLCGGKSSCRVYGIRRKIILLRAVWMCLCLACANC